LTSDRTIQLIDERASRPCVPVGTIDPNACAVRVLAQSDGQPVDGVIVTFALEHGSIAFADVDARTCQAMSDSNGRASVGAQFIASGVASITASVDGRQDSPLRLVRQSDDLTHSISIVCPAEVRAGQRFEVVVACRDGRGRFVRNAKISRLMASRPIDVQTAFRLRRERPNRFCCEIALRESGVWSLAVVDAQTNATASQQVLIRPLAPVRLCVLENLDPRRAPPFQAALLRVRAEDRFGNAADPGRISAIAENASVDTRVMGEEAHVVVSRPEADKSVVDLRFQKPRLRTRTIVTFSPAWLELPPWTSVGEEFATKLIRES
jgi:hypothetical protein